MQTMRFLSLVVVFIGFGFVQLSTDAARPALAWQYATSKYLPLAVVADLQKRPVLIRGAEKWWAWRAGRLQTRRGSAASGENRDREIQTARRSESISERQAFAARFGRTFCSTRNQARRDRNRKCPPIRAAPKVLSVWRSAQRLKGAAVIVADGKYAYLGVMSAGVMIFDISNCVEHPTPVHDSTRRQFPPKESRPEYNTPMRAAWQFAAIYCL